MRCVSNLLSLVLADDELVQASADLLGRRESRPRLGRRRGVGVRGRGSRLGRHEGAGTGGEEAANSREHEVRGCSGRSSRRTAMYFPISRCGFGLNLSPPAFGVSRQLFSVPGLFSKFGKMEGGLCVGEPLFPGHVWLNASKLLHKKTNACMKY